LPSRSYALVTHPLDEEVPAFCRLKLEDFAIATKLSAL